MEINNYNDLEELAKQAVLREMKEIDDVDFLFERQTIDSIFYKIYNDLCNRYGNVTGSYFALHLLNVYEIEIPIR